MDRAVQLSPGRWPMDQPVQQATGEQESPYSSQLKMRALTSLLT